MSETTVIYIDSTGAPAVSMLAKRAAQLAAIRASLAADRAEAALGGTIEDLITWDTEPSISPLTEGDVIAEFINDGEPSHTSGTPTIIGTVVSPPHLIAVAGQGYTVWQIARAPVGVYGASETSAQVVASDIINPLVWVQEPTIVGGPPWEVGRTVSAHAVATGDGTVTYTYQWLRNGGTIPGATGINRLFNNLDELNQLSVTVTASDATNSPIAKTTVSVTVQPVGVDYTEPTVETAVEIELVSEDNSEAVYSIAWATFNGDYDTPIQTLTLNGADVLGQISGGEIIIDKVIGNTLELEAVHSAPALDPEQNSAISTSTVTVSASVPGDLEAPLILSTDPLKVRLEDTLDTEFDFTGSDAPYDGVYDLSSSDQQLTATAPMNLVPHSLAGSRGPVGITLANPGRWIGREARGELVLSYRHLLDDGNGEFNLASVGLSYSELGLTRALKFIERCTDALGNFREIEEDFAPGAYWETSPSRVSAFSVTVGDDVVFDLGETGNGTATYLLRVNGGSDVVLFTSETIITPDTIITDFGNVEVDGNEITYTTEETGSVVLSWTVDNGEGHIISGSVSIVVQAATGAHRVLISTDLGGDDKDDGQAMVHALLLANRLNYRGVVSTLTDHTHSPTAGLGRAHWDDMMAAYALDLDKLRETDTAYPDMEDLDSLYVEGSGYNPSWPPTVNAGIQKIIDEAEAASPTDPLYILGWGPVYDIAAALYLDSTIVPNIRLLTIAADGQDPNKAAFNWLKAAIQGDEDYEDLWWIDSASTFRGMYVDLSGNGTYPSLQSNIDFVDDHIAEHGALGSLYADVYAVDLQNSQSGWGAWVNNGLKMGDTPSLLYVLDFLHNADIDDPTDNKNWAGRFQPWSAIGPNVWTDISSGQTLGSFPGANTIYVHRSAIRNHLEQSFDLSQDDGTAPVVSAIAQYNFLSEMPGINLGSGGSAHNMTPSGVASFVADRGLVITGMQEAGIVSAKLGYTLSGTDLTLIIRTKFNAYDSAEEALLVGSAKTTAGPTFAFWLSPNVGGTVSLLTLHPEMNVASSALTDLDDEEHHTFAMTYRASDRQVTFYADGVQVGQGIQDNAPAVEPIGVAMFGNNVGFFRQPMDVSHLELYERVLSSTEMTSRHEAMEGDDVIDPPPPEDFQLADAFAEDDAGFLFGPEGFTNDAGTTPATEGQSLAIITDKSKVGGNNGFQTSASQRPQLGSNFITLGPDDRINIDIPDKTTSMSLFLLMKTTDPTFVLLGSRATSSLYLGYADSASGSSSLSNNAGTPTFHIENGSPIANRGALQSGIATGAYQIVEVKSANLGFANWGTVQIGGVSGGLNLLLGDVARALMMTTAQAETHRSDILTKLDAIRSSIA